MSTLGPDTLECSNCGTEIVVTASVCHNCGTENENRPGRTISVAHDPSNYETTVSESWYFGVAAGMGLWILGLIISGSVESIAGFIYLVALFVLPISAYFDMQYVRANSGWNPSTVIWVIGLLVPILNIFLGGAYLYRRHETLSVP